MSKVTENIFWAVYTALRESEEHFKGVFAPLILRSINKHADQVKIFIKSLCSQTRQSCLETGYSSLTFSVEVRT